MPGERLMRYFQIAIHDPIEPPEGLPAKEIQARIQKALWPSGSVQMFQETHPAVEVKVQSLTPKEAAEEATRQYQILAEAQGTEQSERVAQEGPGETAEPHAPTNPPDYTTTHLTNDNIELAARTAMGAATDEQLNDRYGGFIEGANWARDCYENPIFQANDEVKVTRMMIKQVRDMIADSTIRAALDAALNG